MRYSERKRLKIFWQTLDMEGDCAGERSVFVWRETEGISDQRRETDCGSEGVSESAAWVGCALFAG